MSISRRNLLRGTGLAMGAGFLTPLLGCATDAHSGATKKATSRKPNIIFILADDLGYGDLGCYGQKVIKTPNVDKMAKQGIRFTQCYAGSTVCAPSRCCLMTGLHTGHAHVRGNARVPLRPEDVTVAEVLKEAGYTTGLVGKWGLGEPDTTGVPNRQGFDYFFGYLNQGNAHNYYPEFLWRNEEMVPLDGNVESETHKRVSVKRAQYSQDLFIEEALQFVQRSKDDPFFLYFAITLPHANNERGRAEGNGMEIPDLGAYANRDWPDPQKGHAAMIARMDHDVGRLMAKLCELGLDDDTIVFFTSDNGPHKEGGADPAFFSSWGPLRGYKRDLYEGGIRVPGIVRWPGHVPEGVLSDHIWTFWDFLPTAAELAGVTCPEGLDGVSFLPTLLGKDAEERTRFLYWEFHEGKSSKQAVRAGRWKGVRLDPKGPLELYDLTTDLGEKNNLAEKHPEIVNKMEGFLAKERTESENWELRTAVK